MIHIDHLAYRLGFDLIVSAKHPYACKIFALLFYSVYGESVSSEMCKFDDSKVLAEASVV